MEGAQAQHGKSSVYVGFRLDRSGVFWTAERHPTYKQAATKNQPEISVRRIGVIANPRQSLRDLDVVEVAFRIKSARFWLWTFSRIGAGAPLLARKIFFFTRAFPFGRWTNAKNHPVFVVR